MRLSPGPPRTAALIPDPLQRWSAPPLFGALQARLEEAHLGAIVEQTLSQTEEGAG